MLLVVFVVLMERRHPVQPRPRRRRLQLRRRALEQIAQHVNHAELCAGVELRAVPGAVRPHLRHAERMDARLAVCRHAQYEPAMPRGSLQRGFA